MNKSIEGIGVDSIFVNRTPPPKLEIVGPFLGKVIKNDDSEDDDKELARVKVWVPQIHGEEYESRPDDLPWARPLACWGAILDDGVKRGVFFVPPKDTWVYVFFERGDVKSPLWLGGWFGKKDEKNETPDQFLKSNYGAKYPEIPGIAIPPFCIRLHGIETPQAATLEWGDPDKDPDILVEIDETPWNNDISTIALKVQKGRKNKWNVIIKNESDGNVEIQAKETITISCKNFRVNATGSVNIRAEDKDTGSGDVIIFGKNSTVVASEDKIQGISPTARGFDAHTNKR